MQKFISKFLLLIMLFVSSNVFAETAPRSGIIRVKLQPEVAARVGVKPILKGRHNALVTGVPALDLAVQKVKGYKMTPLFPYAAKFAEQRAEFGLDRWFEISFDENVDTRDARRILKSTAGVQIAESIVPMTLQEGNGKFRVLKAGEGVTAPKAKLPTNDPRLGMQWHYNNDGSVDGSVAGADINLFEAWKITKGTPNVVVAIIDGGIDVNHVDLAQNLKINEAEKNGIPGKDDDGNGYVDDIYGYNFVTNTPEIYPHHHGTHVAGTVAAVNNNGIGVAGVAGGDGSKDSGIRMISCQIFDSRETQHEADFAKALVYAAENGATIAQCSWGWNDANYYEQAVLDAIDYFQAKAKNETMVGGLCIFATGNMGEEGLFYPAAYPNVLSVAAMACDLTPAPYSNYGDWVSVVAPGGTMGLNEYQGVLSTLPGDSYGFSEGTSMATPHVSGIAALILSKYGKPDFPASTLRQQLESSVNDFYTKNPEATGKFGTGYVDAAKALVMGDGTAPEAVKDLAVYPAQDNATIEWTIPAAQDNNVSHHIIYYSDKAFTAETDLSTLKSALVDTKFAHSGEKFTYELQGLSPTTTYYFAIKAVNRWGDASSLSAVISATTNRGPKMKLDKTSVNLKVTAENPVASAEFSISNTDEGLLKWSQTKTTTGSSISKYSLDKKVLPGNIRNYTGKLGVEPYVAKEVFNTENYDAEEYPKIWKYYESLFAYIGDSDLSKPNAMATRFVVSREAYPEGFNLTHVNIEGKSGQNPVIKIYKGDVAITEDNLLEEVAPSWFAYNYDVKLDEQLFFEPGQSFWVVVDFPAQENQYPLAIAKTDTEVASLCYMSNDNGETWVPLVDALKGSRFEELGKKVAWTVCAVSKNPDWSQLITLSPSEGNVKFNETQIVTVKNDGQPIPNGDYKFNIRFKTNETTGNSLVVKGSMKVSGQKPNMVPAKIVKFGDLLVGEEKTVVVEVYNKGYGLFGGKYGSMNASNISCNSEHFLAPTYHDAFLPRAKSSVELTFAPKAAGSHTAAVTFKDRTGDEFVITVQGVATDPAKISIEPKNINAGILKVGDAAVNNSFVIKNEGNFPLEYVIPKYSDRKLENSHKTAHKFGYAYQSNFDGSTDFAYDNNPELIGATEIQSKFDDNTYLTEPIYLGFQFPFYGKQYDRIYISSYGGIAFGTSELGFRSPLCETSYGLENVGYISAYAHQLGVGPDTKISYAKQDGKFVVKFVNALAIVYDTEVAPISFHLALSANGDIEIFYDDYDGTILFEDGTTLYCGIVDPKMADPFTLTSTEIANRYDSNPTPEGELYTKFKTGTAVKIVAPKANFISNIEPAYAIVNPGESVTVTATIAANESMIAGKSYNDIVILSNDPSMSTAYVRINAVIDGEGLVANAELEKADIDFGKVFRTSVQKLPVTIKNTGKNTLTVNSVSSTGVFKPILETPVEIPAGLSKDVVVTLPTDTEGTFEGVLTIETSVGQLTANLKGQVIGVPVAEFGYTSVEETFESGTTMEKPLTLKNGGNEPLVYAVQPNPMIAYQNDYTNDAKVSYIYSSKSESSDVKFDWVDIVNNGLGTQHNMSYYIHTDFCEVELPFEFPFYGKKYKTMYIYNTGFVSFTKRPDEKIWPEPPANFPGGTFYTNIIAPYWGLHTMSDARTAGTYHYMTKDEIVVSWMEYGNTMNINVCYQLIMKKDGSFKYQYQGLGADAIIYAPFGLAGLSNEDGREGFKIPERYIAFGNAVQFFPVTENTVAPGESKTLGITLLGNQMAGTYETALNIHTNIPASEKVEIPVTLNLTGAPKPNYPKGTLEVTHVVGHMDDPSAGPVTALGAPYEIQFQIANDGNAPFNVATVENHGPAYEDPMFGDMVPLFGLFWYAPEMDWITGELTGKYNWTQYNGEPFTVGKDPIKFSLPINPEASYTPGVYDVPLHVMRMTETGGMETDVINLRFTVTPPPAVVLDKEQIYVEKAPWDYIGRDNVTIKNVGEYQMSYSFRIDHSGIGHVEGDDDEGGVSPVNTYSVDAESAAAVLATTPAEVVPFAGGNYIDLPSEFEFRNSLYYESRPASDNVIYQYGTGNTYDNFIGSTVFKAPAEGINISHIYTAFPQFKAPHDVIIEIVKGNDHSGDVIVATGTINVSKTGFYVIPLDKSIYMNPGEEFIVRVTYPTGVENPAYLVGKKDEIVSNRYMGRAGSSATWYDIASMFENQAGSIGYAITCLETKPGTPWVKIVSPEGNTGTLAVNDALTVEVEMNADFAPLERGNKVMLVIKTDDPEKPYVNFPIILDRNALPVLDVPAEVIAARENATTKTEFTVTEPDKEDMIIRVEDPVGIAKVEKMVSAVDGSNIEFTKAEDGACSVKSEVPVKVTVDISPEFGTAGDHYFTVSAADAEGHEARATVKYAVERVNRAPVANKVEPMTIYKDIASEPIDLRTLFTDPDGDKLTFKTSLNRLGMVTIYTNMSSAILLGTKEGSVRLTITATDPEGASAQVTIPVTIEKFSGVEEITLDTQVAVYPNPAVENINVTCGFNAADAEYSIYDMDGAVIYKEAADCTQGVAKVINVSELNAGVYFVNVVANDKVYTKAFVKK